MGNQNSSPNLYSEAINSKRSRASALKSDVSSSALPGQSKTAGSTGVFLVNSRAKVIKYLSHQLLWNNFLESTTASFAMTHSEIAEIMLQSLNDARVNAASGSETLESSMLPPKDLKEVKEDVQKYLTLCSEINETVDKSKAFDFMSILSSVLLFNSTIPIESKIDLLYSWMDNSGDQKGMSYLDFLLGMVSIQRGIAYGLGKAEAVLNENQSKDVVKEWMKLADPSVLDIAKKEITKPLSAEKFFEFATNRHHPLRKLLEVCTSTKLDDKNKNELNEIVQGNTLLLEKRVPVGDQFLANPPWIKTAEKMVPHGVVSSPAKPSSTLTLDWVHGYRGYDCRNNAQYLLPANPDLIVFFAAALVVVQDTKNKAQTFFSEHTDDVVSMSVHALASGNEALIASGEVGKSPAICLFKWTNGQFLSLTCMRGLLKGAVTQLQFSGDGNKLFAVGLDYTVAIFDTYQDPKGKNNSFGKVKFTAQGPKSTLLHVCEFDKNSFLSCGEKHIIRWFASDQGSEMQEVKLGSLKSKVFLSCARVEFDKDSYGVALGTADGELFIVTCDTSSGKAVLTIKGVEKKEIDDKSAINAIWYCSQSRVLVWGTKAGYVFANKFDKTKTLVKGNFPWLPKSPVSTPRMETAAASMRSVSVHEDGSGDSCRVLMGTQECELLEFNCRAAAPAETMRSVLSGHFKGELWGLSVNPRNSSEYCTVGDDGCMRIWDLRDRKLLRIVNLGGAARCVCYSPDSQFIAVGFGGAAGKAKGKEDGMVKVYRGSDIPLLSASAEGAKKYKAPQACEVREAKQWISALKFSPDGLTLAVGSRDNNVYYYSVSQQFKRKAKFSKHSAGINQIDFSMDSKVLQSCCSAYEILFSDPSSGAQIMRIADVADINWHTWTLTLGWPVLGIWQSSMDGSDVNGVDRLETSAGNGFLATGDDFGKVNVFNYPCVKKGALANSYVGHSSHVTCVRWANTSGANSSGSYLISIGGDDKAVIQWKHTLVDSDGSESKAASRANASAGDDAGSSLYEAEDEAPHGDEFMAVKPWLGAIVAPSAFAGKADPAKVATYNAALGNFSKEFSREMEKQKSQMIVDRSVIEEAGKALLRQVQESGVSDTRAPEYDELDLSWVYGYRGYDCRDNVKYFVSPSGPCAIYHAAQLGIVLGAEKLPGGKKQPVQRYFRGHTDDILSLVIGKVGSGDDAEVVVATGQQGKGSTFVWSPSNMSTLSVLQTKQKSVTVLAFSADCRLLLSLSEDLSIVISDWRSQNVIVSTKGDSTVTYSICPCADKANFSFLSTGEKSIRVWTLAGRNLNSVKVATSSLKDCSPQSFLCSALVAGKTFVIGCFDNSIYVLDGTKVSKRLVHDDCSGKDGAKLKNAKNNSITALVTNDANKLMISGAKDGSIVLWDTSNLCFGVLHRYSLAQLFTKQAPFALQIQSLSFYCEPKKDNAGASAKRKILIGTRGCDIIEVLMADGDYSASEVKYIMRAHCNGELWGVATHPCKERFCTVGDDKTIRFFRSGDRDLASISCHAIGNVSRVACYYPMKARKEGQVYTARTSSGDVETKFDLLAVGFGGRVGNGKEAGGGVVRLYSYREGAAKEESSLEKLAEATDAKQWISDIKFSPDGDSLAVGAHDCKIYIYKVDVKIDQAKASISASLAIRCCFAKHNSVINHLDYSLDGHFLQSNCSAYELLFSDASTGQQISSASELRDVKWATWTCTLGWPVKGVWAQGMDGSDINATCRSRSGHLIATADDFGKVRLLRYPCCAAAGAESLSYGGHSSHVTNVRWTYADEYLISTGGEDKCIMMWKHRMVETTSSGKAKVDTGDMASSADEDEDASEVDDSHAHESAPVGDEAGCVRPWLGAVRAPKHAPAYNLQAPSARLNLSWVHGYTSASAGASNMRVSSNLFYNNSKNVVFPAAAIGVELTPASEAAPLPTQQYFFGHDDDILCLAMSFNRKYVATGQTASKGSKGRARICVWDSSSMRLLCVMQAAHKRGVATLAFNAEGNKLLSVGMDDKNSHILWLDIGGNWSKPQMTVESPADQNPIMFSKWLPPPRDQNELKLDYTFVTGGGSAIHFWKEDGATIVKKQGRFGKNFPQVPITSVAFLLKVKGRTLIAGTATGDLYEFSEGREVVSSVPKAHSGPVLCVVEGRAAGGDVDNKSSGSEFIVSGGKDGFVRVWNSSLQITSEVNVAFHSVVNPMVGSIDIFVDSSAKYSVLVGTYGGEIIELSSQLSSQAQGGPRASAESAQSKSFVDVSNMSAKVLLHSHYKGELWGLAAHPSNPDLIATVGDDSTIRVWSISKRRMVCVEVSKWPCRSVDWHPSGSYLAVGLFELQKGGREASKAKAAPKAKVVADALKCAVLYKYSESAGKSSLVYMGTLGDSVAWISDIKFAPTQWADDDGDAERHDILALASHNKKLYCYEVTLSENSFEVKGSCVFDAHSSAVLHFDFSEGEGSGLHLQTNCLAGELLFSTITGSGNDLAIKQETSASKLAELNSEDGSQSRWASHTCKFGWPVQGVWKPGADMSDINSVAVSQSRKHLAVADDYGQVRLFRYPAVTEASKFVAFAGHSSHVTNVRWTADDKLISVGGNDKCIFVWELDDN